MLDINTLTLISSLVAAFFAFYASLKSNNTSKEIEGMRHSHDLQSFKFKKIYEEYLIILEMEQQQYSGPCPHRNLDGNIDDEDEIMQVVSSQIEASKGIQSAYARIKPFMKIVDKQKIDGMIAKEEKLNSELARQLEVSGSSDSAFNQLILMRSKVLEEILNSIFTMLEGIYSPE